MHSTRATFNQQQQPASPTQRDLLLCIFLRGGADGLNIVVPHGDKDYYRARSTLAIGLPGKGTGSALDLDGYFGFHPALEPFKRLYDDGLLAAIHACGSPDPTHSHFDAMDYMERGIPGDKRTATGWLGRHLQLTAASNDSHLRAVGMGGGACHSRCAVAMSLRSARLLLFICKGHRSKPLPWKQPCVNSMVVMVC